MLSLHSDKPIELSRQLLPRSCFVPLSLNPPRRYMELMGAIDNLADLNGLSPYFSGPNIILLVVLHGLQLIIKPIDLLGAIPSVMLDLHMVLILAKQ
jgi:hypothetical protein